MNTNNQLLRVTNLNVGFRTGKHSQFQAVKGVSFDIPANSTVALVGESGSGKSVSAMSIIGLLPEESAVVGADSAILYQGEDLLKVSPSRLRALRGKEISMIFQEPMTSLNPVFTVGDQIAEALRLHLGMSRRQAWTRSAELLAEVGIPEPARRLAAYPFELSGGQQQRVMIAMAIACEPKLLIADEPTTALDVTIQAQILELLKAVRERTKSALLLITHDLGVVAETVDRVVVMYAGQIVEEATTARLFAAPAHPYTEGLLAAVPRLDEKRERLAAIPGQVPPATSWPQGCRFHPRCPHAWEKCRAEQPPLLDAAPGHRARCWLVAEPGRRGDRGTGGPGDRHPS